MAKSGTIMSFSTRYYKSREKCLEILKLGRTLPALQRGCEGALFTVWRHTRDSNGIKGLSLQAVITPLESLERAATGILLFFARLAFIAFWIAINIMAIVTAIRFVRVILENRLPREVSEIKHAVSNELPYIFITLFAIVLDVGMWLELHEKQPPPSLHHTPSVDPRLVQDVFGGILILFIVSLALVLLKQLHLRAYSILEFLCAAGVAAVPLYNLNVDALKHWDWTVVFVGIISVISSVYFMVRAIENFKKDLDQRTDGTYEKLWDERMSRWWALAWAVKDFVQHKILRPLKVNKASKG